MWNEKESKNKLQLIEEFAIIKLFYLPEVKSPKLCYQISPEDHSGTNNNLEVCEFNFPLWFQNPKTHVDIMWRY
jgi:hypothetical protein